MDYRQGSPRADELLEQLGWVRALAGSLAADPEVADDVLQQVCLLALQRAPAAAREGPRLRAWLATVTRRLVAHRARAAYRRERRERATAEREAAAPSAADVAQRREALRALVEAVAGLDEPDFTLIVDRYFHGFAVSDIASRGGVSEVAIRQRLSRARQRLRLRLQHLLDDEDRGPALRALLPLAIAAHSLQGVGTSVGAGAGAGVGGGSWKVGGAWMAKSVGYGTSVKWAGTLVVVAMLALLVMNKAPDDQPAGEMSPASSVHALPESVATEAPAAPVGGAPVEALAPHVEPSLPSPDSQPDLALVGRRVAYQGRCVEADGRPVAGALVELTGSTNLNLGMPDGPEHRIVLASTTTDLAGRFTFDAKVPPKLDPNQVRVFLERINLPMLEATADGLLPVALTAPPDAAGSSDVGDLVLRHGGTLAMDVRAEGPGPVSVILHYASSTDLSGELGRRRLEAQTFEPGRIELGPLPDGSLSIEVRAAGRCPATVGPFEMAAGQRVDAGLLKLEPGAEIAGRVIDTQGQPVPGAWVVVRPDERFDPVAEAAAARREVAESLRYMAPPHFSRTTDSDGGFVADSLAPGRYSVAAGASGFSASLVSFASAPGPAVEIVLPAEGIVRVRCVDAASEQPIDAVAVSAFEIATQRFELLAAEPSADAGRAFRLSAPVDRQLIVEAPGYPRQAFTIARVETGATRDETLRLVAGCMVSGMVTDSAKKALPDRDVVVANEELGVVGADALVARTDGEGRFVVGPLAPGSWCVTSRGAGFAPKRAFFKVKPGESDRQVTLMLPLAASVSGRLLDAAGAPLAGVAVDLKPFSGLERQRSITDDAGEFTFSEVTPGKGYRLIAATPSFVSQKLDIAEGESLRRDIIVPSAARVTGRVLSGGRPVGGATVHLMSSVGNFRRSELSYHYGRQTVADEHGEYAFELSESGEFALEAVAPHGARGERHPVSVPTSAQLVIDLQLPSLALHGVVRAQATGEPLAGATLSLRLGDVTAEVPSGPDGAFAFECLAPGEVDLAARASGYGRISRRLDPSSEHSASLVLELPPAASLSGKVLTAAGGVPSGDLYLRLVGQGEVSAARVEPVKAGAYRIDEVAPGDYSVAVLRRVIVGFLATEDRVLSEGTVKVEGAAVMDWIVTADDP